MQLIAGRSVTTFEDGFYIYCSLRALSPAIVDLIDELTRLVDFLCSRSVTATLAVVKSQFRWSKWNRNGKLGY
jgi:hypothetical protein